MVAFKYMNTIMSQLNMTKTPLFAVGVLGRNAVSEWHDVVSI